MNNPFKVIYKHKNNKKKIIYFVYIYIGDSVNIQIMNILNKIKKLSLLETLQQLHIDEFNQLVKKYTENWYTYFFNIYHIQNTLINIRGNEQTKLMLIEKYGDKWYNKQIGIPISEKKHIIYSYEKHISNLLKNKLVNIVDDDIYENVNTEYFVNKIVDSSIFTIKGGDNINDDNIFIDNIQNKEDDEEEIEEIKYEENEEIEDDGYINKYINTLNEEADEKIKENTQELKKVLDDDKLFYEKRQLIEFNEEYDNNIYDDDIKNVYNKQYITSLYIYEDDTILTIKNKICCSIRMHSKFGKNIYLLPSKQYLWGEYLLNDKIHKIMIGYKWLRSNEILNIDVEPSTNFNIYEQLSGNLKLLRDNMKKYNSKIKYEDDNGLLLNDYEGYIMNNEIYMITIYDEIGLNYKKTDEILKNLKDIYLKIYFPKLSIDNFKQLLTKEDEYKSVEIYNTLSNDLIAENEIMTIIENIDSNEYKNMFDENHITNVVIHINLSIVDDKKINMYRIFNNFELNNMYPFIQYKTKDGNITHKLDSKEIIEYMNEVNKIDILARWYESALSGITIKVKMKDEKTGTRFMSININERGRLEYKIIWKEISLINIDNIKDTHEYVREILRKINKENNRFQFIIPDDEQYNYAFINSIQKINLDTPINFNDLSYFARLFYPYLSLVIDPRKRQSIKSVTSELSKSGTYLRFKRIANYDLKISIEYRILYYIRNYEFTTKEIIDVLVKQFNITEERANQEYNNVKTKYSYIKKIKKNLKHIEKMPKFKYQGVDINIQGKSIDKYKLRISGAKNKYQLYRILRIVNILIYLYYETYIKKKKERLILKKKLEGLEHIAKLRHKVDEFVIQEKEQLEVKKMVELDKFRLGNEKQIYSRLCQNSGDKIQRRPIFANNNNIEKIIKLNYHYNKKLGVFEKKLKNNIVLKTIGLDEYDENGNLTGNEIHYACDPSINGEHIYVGFLANTKCVPCCFKKDPMETRDKQRLEYFKQCKQKKTLEDKINVKQTGDILYILQDTLNLNIDRLGYLPKYVDMYLNTFFDRKMILKNHYLIETKNNYFLKLGCEQQMPFLNTIGKIFDLTIDQIKEKIIKAIQEDKNDKIFIYLN